MQKQPLIIGIDLTNEYCQASFFNLRKERAQSLLFGTTVARYTSPTVICRDGENEKWLIGEEAMLYAEKTGSYLIKGLLNMMIDGDSCVVGDVELGYEQLLGIYLGGIIEQIQVNSGLMNIENITVTLRKVNSEIKEKLEKVFAGLGIEPAQLKVQNYAESFAYFVLNEDEKLWKDGSLLFDFDNDGFFVKQLSFEGGLKDPLIYINEQSYSLEFSVRDLASALERTRLDQRLCDIYLSQKLSGSRCSAFFTGSGFSETWFEETLQTISRDYRVFKGNNLYVKGAVIAGSIKAFKNGADYPIVCKGRTKASIAVCARSEGIVKEIELSRAACDWYDAGCRRDFILSDDKNVKFAVTSLVSKQRTEIDFDLSSFPERPEKATRVEVSVRYTNDAECEIAITDKGFGEFYPGSDETVKRVLNLEGYI